MPTVLITGANKGIGFALAKQYASDSKNVVIATSRSLERASDLKALKLSNLHVIQLDVNASLEDIKKSFTAIDKVAPKGVDFVIHNAAIGVLQGPEVNFTNSSLDDYTSHFDTNVVGSIKVYQSIYPYWAKSTGEEKRFVFISSVAGLTNNYFGMPSFGYGMSKAAINFFVKEVSTFHTHSTEEAIKNSVTIAAHPGLVVTDMSKDLLGTLDVASMGIDVLQPAQSAEKLKAVFDGLTVEDNSTFKSYDGTTILW